MVDHINAGPKLTPIGEANVELMPRNTGIIVEHSEIEMDLAAAMQGGERAVNERGGA